MFREPLLSPAQLDLEYVQAGLWEYIQYCTVITDEVKRYPNSWSLYFDSKSSQSAGEMRKAEKVFPPLETSQKLLRMKSLRPTVQLKYFVKGALFLKKTKLQWNFKYFG